MRTLETCTFCEIIHGRQPGMILYEDNNTLVLKDHKPVNRFHVLAIPKTHIPTEADLAKNRKDRQLVKALIRNGKKVMSAIGADMGDIMYGFHKDPYLTIRHLHLHLISPRRNLYFDEQLYQFNTKFFISASEVLTRLGEPKIKRERRRALQEEEEDEEEEQDNICCVIL